MTHHAVVEQLRTVLDPCSITMGTPIDLVDMGLVEDVESDGARVRVRLVLTDTSCVFFGELRRHISDALRQLPWVNDVAVEIDGSVLWTPDRMRRRSGASAAAPP